MPFLNATQISGPRLLKPRTSGQRRLLPMILLPRSGRKTSGPRLHRQITFGPRLLSLMRSERRIFGPRLPKPRIFGRKPLPLMLPLNAQKTSGPRRLQPMTPLKSGQRTSGLRLLKQTTSGPRQLPLTRPQSAQRTSGLRPPRQRISGPRLLPLMRSEASPFGPRLGTLRSEESLSGPRLAARSSRSTWIDSF